MKPIISEWQSSGQHTKDRLLHISKITFYLYLIRYMVVEIAKYIWVQNIISTLRKHLTIKLIFFLPSSAVIA